VKYLAEPLTVGNLRLFKREPVADKENLGISIIFMGFG